MLYYILYFIILLFFVLFSCLYWKNLFGVQELWPECEIKQCLRVPILWHHKVQNVKSVKWDILNKLVLKTVQVSKSIVITSRNVLLMSDWWLIHNKINKRYCNVTKPTAGLKTLTKPFAKYLFNFFFRLATLLY